MAALKTPQKTSKRQELREDSIVTLYARAWMFYEENKKLVYGALAGLVVLILMGVGYVLYQDQQQAEAQELLAQVATTYEQGNYQAALEGTEGTPGLLDIADDYGSTQAGNLATFYAADALYRMGEYDRALEYFQRFDKTEDFIGASALAAMGSIYEDREEFATAAEYYQQAANQFDNDLTSPRYLIDAGRAYAAAGAYDQALEMYQTVQERYPDSNQAETVEKRIAQVRTKQR